MKRFSILSIMILIFGLAVCVSIGYLLSTTLLSTGLFESVANLGSNQITVYAIDMQSSDNVTDLNDLKSTLQNSTGAGYVYNRDNTYHLLASVYENLADAELVKTNLKNNGYSPEILKIEIPTLKFSGNFSANEKNVLTNALQAKQTIFKALYDIAISLDTTVSDKTQAKLDCNNTFSKLVTIKSNFETIFAEKLKSDNFQTLHKSLENTYNHLSLLISEKAVTPTQSYSSLIKFTYCKILLEN